MKKIEKELAKLYAEKATFTKYGVDVPQSLINLINEKEGIKNKPKRKILNRYELIDAIKSKLELLPDKSLSFTIPRKYCRTTMLARSEYWNFYTYNKVDLDGFYDSVNCGWSGDINSDVDIETLRFLNKKLDQKLAKLK